MHFIQAVSCCRVARLYLQVAPASANGDSILTGKDLGVLSWHHRIEIIPPSKEVISTGVHVPVKHLCGRSLPQGAVCYQADVRVVRLYGEIEG